MNILITGAGFENKGAEAMLRTVQSELSMRVPNVFFYATVFERERKCALEAGFIPVTNEWSNPRLLNYLRCICHLSRRAPDRICLAINNLIYYTLLPGVGSSVLVENDIDTLIDVSGYSYHDGGVGRIMNTICGIRSSTKVSRKNYFLPQAWGGFTTKVSKYWMNQMHAHSTMLFARDAVSFNYLMDTGISEKTIREAPDIALLFKGYDLAVGKAILRASGLAESTRPIIGVVPNMRVYERTLGRGTGNEYLQVLESLIRYCVEKLNADVVILPNECILAGEIKPDDRFLCSLLMTRFDPKGRIVSLTSNYRAEEVKSVIGNFDFVIASRFHSLVFALSQAVPVLALGWSHKYIELLRLFSVEGCLVPHDALHMQDSLNLLQSTWDHRIELAKNIQRALPAIKDEANQMFDNISESLRS